MFFTFAALLSCFVNILQLIFPFYMFTIYSNIVISYSTISLANITVIAFFAIMVLGGFNYIRSRLLAMAGKKMVKDLRKDIFAGMVKGVSRNSAQAYRTGLQDLDTLKAYTSAPAIYALFDAPWSPFYLVLIFLFQPVLGAIATLGAAVMIGLSVLQEYLIRESMKTANLKARQNQRFVDSFLRNVEVINGMGMIQAITDRFLAKNSEVISNQTKSSYHAGTIQALIKPLQNVIQVLIYCAGAVFAMTRGMDIGLVVAASIIMGRGLAPLMQVMSSWRMTQGAKEAYQRVKAFSDFLENQTDTMPLPEPTGHLQVESASFRIGGQTLVNNVSFALDPGHMLGIIGPSGAGKTTLCRMLLGIAPCFGGNVLLDGSSIFSRDKEAVGRFIGYLPQEIELFPGTVAQNIARLGEPQRASLERAIALSGCEHLVNNLPDGLNTHLEGADGMRLSGGQRQKVGLARALYNNPKLLVLDEPTSNLDEAGEQQLLQTLETLGRKRSCTCIMVTHKPALLQSMDSILVMQNGAVAMFGPKNDVFAKLAGGK
ncbi:MAG: type I secretion system permease/ATPase [Desulfotignum sp.]|nr:type I secretion system permease/ATPase [Desulfotignum sp.]